MKRLGAITLVLMMVLTMTGCPNPELARKTSTELIKVQADHNKGLAEYFAANENFLDAQLAVTIRDLDELTAENAEDYATKLRLQMEAKPNASPEDLTKIMAQITTEISQDAAEAEALKRGMVERVTAVKEFHREYLASQSSIFQSQQQLDQYIQLGNGISPLIVEQTLGKVREKSETASKWIDKATKTLEQIQALIAPRTGKAVTK